MAGHRWLIWWMGVVMTVGSRRQWLGGGRVGFVVVDGLFGG